MQTVLPVPQVPTPRPYGEVSKHSTTWPIWLVLLIVVGVASWKFGFWIPLSPAYGQLLTSAKQSPAVTELLGGGLTPQLGARGIVYVRQNIGYAQVVIPVKGTSGKGTLYGILRSIRGQWQVSDLEVQCGPKTEIIIASAQPSQSEPRVTGFGTVYLLPLGYTDSGALQLEAQHIRQRFGIKVEVLPSQAVDPKDEDPSRNQLIAENVINSIRRTHPDIEDDYAGFLIAVTEKDLYIREYTQRYNWDFAFGFRRNGRFGVISTARLNPGSLTDVGAQLFVNSRLRKMLTKFIGVLYFQLPLSNDPTSVLYSGIKEARDVDFMTESFTGALGEWNPMPDSNATCSTLFASRQRPPAWRLDCDPDAPHDVNATSFLNDLQTGIFVQRHSDFRLGKDLPVAFQRMYRPRDDRSRAFGIGTNHSFDIFLVGDSRQFSYIDLIEADGGRARFRRSKPGSGYTDVIFRSIDPGEFSGATLKWNGNGWDVTRLDGRVYVFPSANASSTPQQSALLAIRDNDRVILRLVRDAKGNLVTASHFEGDELNFEYDDHARVVHAIDNHGRTVDYTYDNRGRLTQTTDNSGHTERFEYDPSNQMAEIWWEGKRVLTNEYDKYGRLAREINVGGETFSYTYDQSNERMNMAHFTRPDGYVTHFYFESYGGTTLSLPEAPGKSPGQH